MSRVSPQQAPTIPHSKPKVKDGALPHDLWPLRCEASVKDMTKYQGAPSLHSMAMRQALEVCDCDQLSQLSPVMLASISKTMWTTIKALSNDANRWRLLRRRACLLDRRMLDGPYCVPGLVTKEDEMDLEDGFRPSERLTIAMDEIIAKWTVVPYSDDLPGPEQKREHVLDSADIYIESGRVHRVKDGRLQPGQRRWEKEISAQLLFYRLCLLFQHAPMLDAGAWLFILRGDDGAEVWLADRGNFHWFLAVCPDVRAWNAIVELLELLISDRCVVRYNDSPEAEQPTAGEPMGAAWSR